MALGCGIERGGRIGRIYPGRVNGVRGATGKPRAGSMKRGVEHALMGHRSRELGMRLTILD